MSAAVVDLASVQSFLSCPTPRAWVTCALANQDILLVDHANCEKKAAATAINLMYRYVEDHRLLSKLSRLAREELRHFEQVIAIMLLIVGIGLLVDRLLFLPWERFMHKRWGLSG